MVNVQTVLDTCLSMSQRSACFNDETFWGGGGKKEKFLALQLLSSSTGLSGFPGEWTLD